MGFMDNFTSDSPVTVKQPDYYGMVKEYYGNMFKCWYSKYDVIEVKNDRIVIGIGNTVTAAVNAANLAAA